MRYMVRLLVFLFVFPAFAAPAKKLVRGPKPVKDSYIVVLNASERGKSAEAAASLATKHGARVRYVFKEAFPGFVAQMSEGQANAMLHDPRVERVEQDAYGELAATQVLPSYSFDFYHLDRIDQRQRGYSGYQYQPTYNYCQTGEGVKVYVIDSGVWRDHVEFLRPGGITRVTDGLHVSDSGWFEGTAYDPCPTMTTSCEHPVLGNISHGTAVASLIGGNTYGVAKGVTIVPIRIAMCDNTIQLSWVLQGLDAVANEHQPGQPAVVNMSFTFGWSYEWHASFEYAVNRVIDDGVPVVAAAGNHARDVGSFMPAMFPRVITAGGSDIWDARWLDPFDPEVGSNWGAIDIFAPASSYSAHMWSCNPYAQAVRDPAGTRNAPGPYNGNSPFGTVGTSFSAAYVTGVVAQYLQAYPTATPAQVENWLINNATTGAMNPNWLAAPNRLLYTNCL